MDRTSQVVTVEGHRVTLSNLDKVMYPATGTTKADVLSYYATVAPLLIPLAANRAATRKRWVHGVGTESDPGPAFFQKNLEAQAPEWVQRRTIEHSTHRNEYPLVNDLATLTWLAQMSALEIHVPQWKFSDRGERMNPDRLVLDLDPGEGCGLADCAAVAEILRGYLTGMGLEPFPVSSGSKGIHLYAALDLTSTSEQVSAVAHELARAVESAYPKQVVSSMKKTARTGKVFVDWSQNNGSKTTITPYSLRGTFRPFVAAPRTWAELGEPGLAQLDVQAVIRRVASGLDPLGALVARSTGARSAEDRLGTYRDKRTPGATPEPMPSPGQDGLRRTANGASFVIHEHHARRLHWDLRLEHEGVLASWALPKGVPTTPTVNHLAVRTEDHPLEYGSFEGTIPHGQYGAGTISIWDSGTYRLEKWRDDEVIATLLPDPANDSRPGEGLGGPRRIALIRTGGSGQSEKNWLIHLMKADAAARLSPPPPPVSGAAPGAGYSPMLATKGTPRDLLPEEEWAIEMKWDGIRILAAVAAPPDSAGDGPGPGGGRVRLTTRNGLDVSAAYPEVVGGLVEAVGARSVVLDGEIVAMGPGNRPSFSRLQTRMSIVDAGAAAAAARTTPATFLVFDAIDVDGRSLTGLSYDRRREQLRRVVAETRSVRVPASFDGNVAAAVQTSLDLGVEGIVAKRHDSLYQPGRRSSRWVKITHHRTQEVVVGGWRRGEGNRAATIGALLLGIPHETGLRYVGRVGTGFTDRALAALRSRLDELESGECPFGDLPAEEAARSTWVRPVLVGEVEFAEWTPGGRLRHPSWRGLRPDKEPGDVTREPDS